MFHRAYWVVNKSWVTSGWVRMGQSGSGIGQNKSNVFIGQGWFVYGLKVFHGSGVKSWWVTVWVRRGQDGSQGKVRVGSHYESGVGQGRSQGQGRSGQDRVNILQNGSRMGQRS